MEEEKNCATNKIELKPFNSPDHGRTSQKGNRLNLRRPGREKKNLRPREEGESRRSKETQTKDCKVRSERIRAY